MNKIAKFIRSIDYKLLSMAIIVLCMAVVFVFFPDSFARFMQSLLYLFKSLSFYFSKTFGDGSVPAPTNPIISGGTAVEIPTNFSQYLYQFRAFSVALRNKDLFLFYLVDVILFVFNVFRFISLIPIMWGLSLLFKKMALTPGENENGQDTKALIKFKMFEARFIYPVKDYFVNYFIFLKDNKRYFALPVLILSFGFGFVAMGVDVLAWYFYFAFNLFDASSILSPVASIFFTLIPFFAMIKKTGTMLLIVLLYEVIRRGDAVSLLKAMQKKNEELCAKLGVATIFLGPPGIGKTQMLTSVALDLEKYVRKILEKILMSLRKDFPYFPWSRLELWLIERTGQQPNGPKKAPESSEPTILQKLFSKFKLKKRKGPKRGDTDTKKEDLSKSSTNVPFAPACVTPPAVVVNPEEIKTLSEIAEEQNNVSAAAASSADLLKHPNGGLKRERIVNRDQINEEVMDIWTKFDKSGNKEDLFGYEDHYKKNYYNGSYKNPLADGMSTYAQAFFLYNAERPIADGNFPIRFDNVLKEGYFKIWDYDYFKHDNYKQEEYSKYQAIIKFDAWRILNPHNTQDEKGRYAREGGVHCVAEVDKERGNKNDWVGTSGKHDEDANQRNDGYNTAVKLERHQESLDNKTIGYVLYDTQREPSVNLDLTDICESKIRIKARSDLKVSLFGFVIDYVIYHLIMDPWDKFYIKYINKRNINTLPMHLAKGFIHIVEKSFEKKVGRFGFQELSYRHERGGTAEEVGDKSDGIYYMIQAKMGTRRYASAHYQAILAEQRLSATDGYLDAQTYKFVIMTPDEFKAQDSYFYDKLTRWVDPNAANKAISKGIGIQ